MKIEENFGAQRVHCNNYKKIEAKFDVPHEHSSITRNMKNKLAPNVRTENITKKTEKQFGVQHEYEGILHEN